MGRLHHFGRVQLQGKLAVASGDAILVPGMIDTSPPSCAAPPSPGGTSLPGAEIDGMTGELYACVMNDNDNLEVMHRNRMNISSRTRKRKRGTNGIRRYKKREFQKSQENTSC